MARTSARVCYRGPSRRSLPPSTGPVRLCRLALFVYLALVLLVAFSAVLAKEIYRDEAEESKNAAEARNDEKAYDVLANKNHAYHTTGNEMVGENIETEADFIRVVNHKAAIIMYKDHNCIHCKLAISDFLDAALRFSKEYPVEEAIFAVLECRFSHQLREICEREGIHGFPTYFLYRNAEKFSIVHNDRKSDTLLKIMKRIAGPVTAEFKPSDLTPSGARDVEFPLQPEIVIYIPKELVDQKGSGPALDRIAYMKSAADLARVNYQVWQTSDFGIFKNTAEFVLKGRLRDLAQGFWKHNSDFDIEDYSFDKDSVLPKLNPKEPIYSIFHKNELPVVFTDALLTDYKSENYLQGLKNFTIRERFPLLVNATPSYFGDVSLDVARKMVYFIYGEPDGKDDVIKYVPLLRKLAQKYRNDVNVFLLDGALYYLHLWELRAPTKFPYILIRESSGSERWILDLKNATLTNDSIENWFAGVISKKIHPFYRSDSDAVVLDPKTNIYHMNANSLGEYIENSDHDNLVLYHSSGCENCIRFWPKFQALSRAIQAKTVELKAKYTIRVLEFDVAKNDLPASSQLQSPMLPLMVLYPVNRKMIIFDKELTEVDTEQTIKDVISFLDKNVHHVLLVPEPAALDKYKMEL